MRFGSHWIVALTIGAVGSSACAQQAADFYVSPAGNDAWSGTAPAPNAAGGDGPFATVTRAQEAVRALKAAEPDRADPIVVQVREGTHYLEAPLRFGPDDSGREGAPVVWTAYPGEKPRLSGGRLLTGWTVGADGRWRTLVPEGWSFIQLFVNGERRLRPRLPREGYYYIEREVASTPGMESRGFDRLGYVRGDIDPNWRNLQDVEILPFHQWTMSRMRIGSMDAEQRIVTLSGPTCSNSYWAGLQQGHRYLIENVAEALEEPGEWYLDSVTRELTYIPMPGETPATTEVIAPYLDRLVVLGGEPDLGLYTEHLRFEGLAFAHTNWATPAEGFSFPQAEASMPAAIAGTGVRDCVWDGCTVTQVAGYAIELGRACKRNRIANCVLYDLGAGGVRLGETGRYENEEDVPSHQVVENCLIARGGRTHPAGIGVWIGQSPFNRIEHNTIADFYYTGISMGWSWGYAPSDTHDNEIAHNLVYGIGQEVLSDMGGIYTLGLSDGSTIHHNVFRDILCYPPGYGGWGIYFDEGTTHILAEKNLVYNTRTGSFHQHYGRENLFRNNILAFSERQQLQRTRMEEHLSFTFERNIVYWSEGPLLGSNWSDDQYKLDHNLYWQVDGEEPTFAQWTLNEWKGRGQDANSLVADPLFVDPEHYDFRLKPESPAFSLGFEEFDVSDAGCHLPADVMPDLAQSTMAFPPPEPIPAFAIEEGFEFANVGETAPGATTIETPDTPAAMARVTDETAATGSHSLKLTDAPGQNPPWNPHLFYAPAYGRGRVAAHFDFRADSPDGFFHEWRTAGDPYKVGPSIRLRGGWLVAGDRQLVEIPVGQWIGVDIEFGVGADSDGTWSIAVMLPDMREPVLYEGLPCAEGFDSLQWWGFVCDSDAEATYYLDNLRLEP